ncbi:hypothetical protein [Actinotalea sp. K2]|uniref:hypothetical protein n=1 Tax=Actinotalea sp. K2 TaxID=2939438 RepID=UPI002017F864|nr:hypothetical protein [Actinotalea sp. K2]MCL3859842.1 hypothetical protein [Actinotalea sp. K2]
MNDIVLKATARSWVGLAVLVLPLLLITIDGTVLVLAAIWALVTLRGVAANQDLAAEHEHELMH